LSSTQLAAELARPACCPAEHSASSVVNKEHPMKDLSINAFHMKCILDDTHLSQNDELSLVPAHPTK
jgi:hypothetical protein